jgi:hypothetical protein
MDCVCLKQRAKRNIWNRGGGGEGVRTTLSKEDLYPTPDKRIVIELSRMKWTGPLALTREMRSAYKVLHGNVNGKDSLEDVGVEWEGSIKTSGLACGPVVPADDGGSTRL